MGNIRKELKDQFTDSYKKEHPYNWLQIVYREAKSRCENPKSTNYKDYGGRGIKFVFKSKAELLAALGEKPSPQHSIDRIDTNGNYCAGNVRWATSIEQNNNRRPEIIRHEVVTRNLSTGFKCLYKTQRYYLVRISGKQVANAVCRYFRDAQEAILFRNYQYATIYGFRALVELARSEQKADLKVTA